MSQAQQNTLILLTGLIIMSIFGSPTNYIMWLSILTILGCGIITYVISTGWVTSLPNHWLLIIENGKLKKSGIGLKTFKWWNQTCVTFPSTIQGVRFSASQVTKENFGIDIEGIVYWSVYRDGDGPFKCYKYTQGSDANENVKQVTESIVRSQISNTTLINVLKKRVELRETVTASLRKQLEGWGIWPETVEITEVRISSGQLFKDMQTEFRFKHKELSEKAKQSTTQTLEEQREKYKLEYQTVSRDIDTQLEEFQQQQNLKREGFKNEYEKNKTEIEKEKNQQDKELNLLLEQVQNDQSMLRVKNSQQVQKLRNDNELENKKLLEQVENKMNQTNLELLRLNSTAQMYQNMHNLNKVELNQYTGPDNFNQLSQAMPAINLVNQTIKQ